MVLARRAGRYRDDISVGAIGQAAPSLSFGVPIAATKTIAFPAPSLDGERLLPLRTVSALTSWSRTSLNRLIKAGKFPPPLKIGRSKIAFRESEVRAYIEAQLRRPGSPSRAE
jgi:predicted DNA-binding transcriptional regulator AlpA